MNDDMNARCSQQILESNQLLIALHFIKILFAKGQIEKVHPSIKNPQGRSEDLLFREVNITLKPKEIKY
ncbi:unnamed protein product [Paramecium primaurelia]|uniref:Uncharacterized protein n=1 Tax=Paramecium primaurelia TaxID=5886 RepID=A0A8S1QRY5_PARPR|nr:unnamed protein product [Paramecium primaurelia]